MKSSISILLCFVICTLSACTSAGKPDYARISQIGDRALDLAERTGHITPDEAALVREIGVIILPKAPTPEPTLPSGTSAKTAILVSP